MRLVLSTGKFIDMLAKDHPRNTQGIGQAAQDHVPIPTAGDHVITTADHQWSPHDQDSELSQGDILQRPGVKQHKEDTQAHQNGRIPVGKCDQHNPQAAANAPVTPA